MKIKEIWKKFWNLLWKDDSWKGWLFSIVVLFIFIKFIFFPVLGLLTGTTLPLAIVESCSMYHDGNLLSSFDGWWQTHEGKYNELNITQKEFSDFKMRRGFNKGDILFILGANPDKLKVGDIIIFSANQKIPIIHRIISIREDSSTGEKIFSTEGDNNNGQLPAEREIRENQLIGKAVFKLAPYLGWVKLIFFEYQKPSSERGFCEEN